METIIDNRHLFREAILNRFLAILFVTPFLLSCEDSIEKNATGKTQIIISFEGNSGAPLNAPYAVVAFENEKEQTLKGLRLNLTEKNGGYQTDLITLGTGVYKISRLTIFNHDGNPVFLKDNAQPQSSDEFTVLENQVTTLQQTFDLATMTKTSKAVSSQAKYIFSVFVHWANVNNSKFRGQIKVPDNGSWWSSVNPYVYYNINSTGYKSVEAKLITAIPGHAAYFSFEVDLPYGQNTVEFYAEYSHYPAPGVEETTYDGSAEKPYVLDNITDDSFTAPDSWMFGTAEIVVVKTPTSYFDWSYYGQLYIEPVGEWEIILPYKGIPTQVDLHYSLQGTYPNGVTLNDDGFVQDIPAFSLVDFGPYRKYTFKAANIVYLNPVQTSLNGTIDFYAQVTYDYGLGTKITHVDNNFSSFQFGF